MKIAKYYKMISRSLRNKYRETFKFFLSKSCWEVKRKLLSDIEANSLIGNKILSDKPLLVARFGSSELLCIRFYLKYRLSEKNKDWTPDIRNEIQTFAGFYPTDTGNLDKMCQLYIDIYNEIDILGFWNVGEHEIFKIFKNNHIPIFVPLASLEPYYFPKQPWSRFLKGKTVLVVHPFEESIIKQFQKRQFLFSNEMVLPDFELKTISTIQTFDQSKSRFANWFDSLSFLCEQIKQTNFDIAIIGAGSYGMPLAAYVKSIGKQAIHLGGATQILFGIKGKRWDELFSISKLYNDYWIRPGEVEKPINFKDVDNGCYW